MGSVNRARAPNKPEAELEIRTINPLDQTVTSGSATRMPVLLTIMLMAGGSLVIAILRRTPPSAGSPRSSSCSLASPKACRSVERCPARRRTSPRSHRRTAVAATLHSSRSLPASRYCSPRCSVPCSRARWPRTGQLGVEGGSGTLFLVVADTTNLVTDLR